MPRVDADSVVRPKSPTVASICLYIRATLMKPPDIVVAAGLAKPLRSSVSALPSWL